MVPQISVGQTKDNEKFYSYLYPFGDLAQQSFHGGFHEFIDHESFLKGFK
jgi:hypothetical protein